jgi:hypothetical protein
MVSVGLGLLFLLFPDAVWAVVKSRSDVSWSEPERDEERERRRIGASIFAFVRA